MSECDCFAGDADSDPYEMLMRAAAVSAELIVLGVKHRTGTCRRCRSRCHVDVEILVIQRSPKTSPKVAQLSVSSECVPYNVSKLPTAYVRKTLKLIHSI